MFPGAPKISIQEILDKTGTKPEFMQMVKKKKLEYYGHMPRTEEDGLDEDISEGCVPGKRERNQSI